MKTIVVCGPTATGKTSLAVKIAVEAQKSASDSTLFEIVSADSRQVYRGMDLGTGKDLFEYSGEGWSVPYNLIDIADPQDNFTLYDYQKKCYQVLKDISSSGNIPLICGGTGLYIESVLGRYALADAPENPELRAELKSKSRAELEQLLSKVDLEFREGVDCSSRKRIIRALEIAGYGESHSINYTTSEAVDVQPLILVAHWSRDELVRRIDLRLEQRLEQGMVAEVKGLLDSGVSVERLLSFGMEYKYITLYLTGKLTYSEMKQDLAVSIHRLAKRQRTWFRGMQKRGYDTVFVDMANKDSVVKAVNSALEF